ncbi:MAG: hypothetical protein WBB37_05335 [bacterium]
MKINRIEISEYGPLKNFTITPGDFECIFGLNETGKTALVEVMSYSLFRKTAATLRYDKPKEFEIKVDDNGNLHTLPAKRSGIELPPSDIAGLLYVQASESAVYDESTSENFWDRLKTMFTSIGKGITFARLDAKIVEAVKIQPKKLDWEKDKQSHIEQKKQRAQELGKCIKDIGEIEKQQDQLQKLKVKQQNLDERLKSIENFKKFKVFSEVAKLYEGYLADKTHLKDYERYKHEYFSRWQELNAQMKAGQNNEAQLNEVKKEIIELEKDMMELKRKEDFITAEGLKECIIVTQEKIKEPPILYPMVIVAVSLILVLFSLITVIPKIPSLIIFIISLIVFAFYMYRKHTVRKIMTTKRKWLKTAKRLYPDISTLKELAERIEATEKRKIEKTTLFDEKKKNEKRLLKGQSAAEAAMEISELRNKTGLAEIDDLKKKLEEKRKIEDKLNEKTGKIYGILSENDDKKWDRMISTMRVRPQDTEPDLSSGNEISDDLRKITEEINTLEQNIEVFNKTLKASFNITDYRVAFIDYDKLRRELKEYELEMKAALTARKILKEMSSELDEYIQNIIKGDQSLTEYFEIVTDKYIEVRVKNKNFMVVNKKGDVFHINHLSSGTQDQLLLCFRIAALKKLYPDGCFLLLDDAFIFADWQRRNKLVELLKKFVDQGNQVIYLTSDDHTRDILKESGARITTI